MKHKDDSVFFTVPKPNEEKEPEGTAYALFHEFT